MFLFHFFFHGKRIIHWNFYNRQFDPQKLLMPSTNYQLSHFEIFYFQSPCIIVFIFCSIVPSILFLSKISNFSRSTDRCIRKISGVNFFFILLLHPRRLNAIFSNPLPRTPESSETACTYDRRVKSFLHSEKYTSTYASFSMLSGETSSSWRGGRGRKMEGEAVI